ncbi:MAG: YidC/Oxa1 family membrane protein insertase [Oscillospiraceae bacterium]|jgi:YidC/Oxa1 family membrane protein insertase|nr:YidC/Oxa1 family membrane protein insertase [Oscillospiraceae bacterium]
MAWDPLNLGPFLGHIILWFFNLTNNYGFAIILLTLFIKILMFPLTIKNQKSAANSMKYTDKRKEIRNKYKNDRKKMNDEILKLSQKEGVNVFGGCLPSVLSVVILLAISSIVAYPLTNILHIEKNKVSEALKIVDSKDNGEKSAYSEIRLIKVFSEEKSNFSMFNDDEAKSIEELSKGFNFFGVDLLTTPKNKFFNSFLWIIPVLSFSTSAFSFYISKKLKQIPVQNDQGCAKFSMYPLFIFSALFAYNNPAAVGFYYIIINLIDLIQKFVMEKFFSIYLINAKKEASRVLMRLMEEKKVKSLS